MVDLLVLTSLDYQLFMVFTFFYKTSYLSEEVNRTEPSPSVTIACLLHTSPMDHKDRSIDYDLCPMDVISQSSWSKGISEKNWKL
jgi:hypothetical protein